MKKLNKIYWSLLFVTLCNSLHAQEQKQSKEMQAWMTYMTPGKMHEMMAKSAGLWSEDVTMWMAPDSPPMKSTSTAMNKMIMGNRYLQGMHRGIFNGMPFEGISVIGYDNAKNVFVSSWIDNMGTGMLYAEGKWNETSKSIEFTGNEVDPMTGKEMKVREVMKFIDDNSQSMEMYMTPVAGKEYKSMEIKYTRKAVNPQTSMPVKQPPVAPIQHDDKK